MRGTIPLICRAAAVLLLVVPLWLQAATFHAILVADTADASIGASAATDLNRARLFAEAIAEHYGNGNITTISGTAANPQGVLAIIDSLEVGLDDFVFFYYTGHGGTGRAGSPWPRLSFGKGELEGVDLLLRIQQRTPVRHLTVFDACNGSQRMPPRRAPASAGFQPAQVDRLFKTLKGSIVVTSSEAPFVSYADSEGRGSRFSTSFFGALEQELSSPVGSDSWKQLLEQARQATQDAFPDLPQRPKFLTSNSVN